MIEIKAMAARDHPELALSALRRRLAPGEEAVVELADPRTLRIRLPMRVQFRGGRRGVIHDSEPAPQIDRVLVKALQTAHRTLAELKASPLLVATAATRAPATTYQRQICRLAYLAPDLQLAILDGRQPAAMTLHTFLQAEPPLNWDAQRRWWRSL